MLDYIVVGLGLSGIAISRRLEERNKNFIVFEDNSQKSSLVAGGLFNPVILKRFTLVWNANEQMKIAIPFYKEMETQLQAKIVYPIEIYRKFFSAEEQNNWFEAADKPLLSEYLDTNLVKDINPNIPSEFSFGRVRQTGVIDTDILIKEYRNYLKNEDKIQFERFDYAALQINEDSVSYNGISAKQIIFCEGFGMQHNPFFNYLPLRGNKGEYITIYAEALQLKEAVKSSVFIIPLGNDLYKVGATYNNQDKDPQPGEAARQELVKKITQLITCKFEVVDQSAGIRPASKDRKPMLGRHPKYKNLYCCNGFGSRGVLISPMVSKQLIEFIENEVQLPPEIDLQRFSKKHYTD
ncbi:NAD(P)/FAD-dependent oxidoreductase [Salegentibacter salegens]|uniref:Glycine/D-amino acid oxidase n=1 Tax=Salegentibacter salegens TaxID=143223 RepID=A0A1M7N1Y9_9FLAO|nr:FAD-dependent oxidoreductase [Salegentibacter salegens]PRX52375.1 glycine/D-amino acid oxidase-like deaminating enzyme [Salegentibacter salegens]SHM97358.1 Glycine/D-amino acid oxidase [Salegentibacter salegens]